VGSGTGTLWRDLNRDNHSGANTVTISGVTYTKAESVTLTATRTSGNTLSPGNSAAFTVIPGAVNAGTSTVIAKPYIGGRGRYRNFDRYSTLDDANGNPVSGKAVSLTAGGGISTITTLSGQLMRPAKQHSRQRYGSRVGLLQRKRHDRQQLRHHADRLSELHRRPRDRWCVTVSASPTFVTAVTVLPLTRRCWRPEVP